MISLKKSNKTKLFQIISTLIHVYSSKRSMLIYIILLIRTKQLTPNYQFKSLLHVYFQLPAARKRYMI